MPAIKRKDMRLIKLLPSAIRLIGQARNIRKAIRRILPLAAFLCFVWLSVFSFGCAPSSSPDDGKQISSDTAPNDLPELTEEIIRERINDTSVRDVPEETGAGEPISWRFNEDEPKELVVVEKKIDGARAAIVLDIKTRSAPGWRNPRALAGQIRTEWELKTGWALRRWEIIRTENVSMKYKNLPKLPAQNSNR